MKKTIIYRRKEIEITTFDTDYCGWYCKSLILKFNLLPICKLFKDILIVTNTFNGERHKRCSACLNSKEVKHG